MTKRKLHQLKGQINYCWPGISKSKIYKNQPFYVLEITTKTLLVTKNETVYVFPNLVSQEVWNLLKSEAFENQLYAFWCEKRVRGWRLRNMVKIN